VCSILLFLFWILYLSWGSSASIMIWDSFFKRKRADCEADEPEPPTDATPHARAVAEPEPEETSSDSSIARIWTNQSNYISFWK
jgi:hypothetical protein